MGIKAICPCGAQFMAKPELAGRTVKCPSCGQAFQVPAAPAAPRQPAAFQVACTCGRTYQVQPAMAGRQVRCQACGGEFVVPQPPGTQPPGARTPIPAAPTAPAPDPLADPLGDLGNLGDLSSFGDPLGATLPAAGFPAQSLPAAGYSPAGGAARPKSKRKPINTTAVVSIITTVLVVLAILGIAVGTFIFFPFGRGYSSPEAVWNAHKTALERRDFGTFYDTLTPEASRPLVTLLSLVTARLASQEQEMAAIAKKHGLDSPQIPGLTEDTVANKRALFVDVAKYLDKKIENQARTGQSMAVLNRSYTELKDVVIEGDSARGMQTISANGNTVEIPIEFRKVDGGWLIHRSL